MGSATLAVVVEPLRLRGATLTPQEQAEEEREIAEAVREVLEGRLSLDLSRGPRLQTLDRTVLATNPLLMRPSAPQAADRTMIATNPLLRTPTPERVDVTLVGMGVPR